MRCPLPGLLHGLLLALFGAALFWTARHQFWLLCGAFSGFLLVAPILATGLYAVSRALQRTGAPTSPRRCKPGARATAASSSSACCSRLQGPAG